MPKGRPSGYALTQADVPIILGMSGRGDRDHDIAAWFGVNQGRVAEAKDGKFGPGQAAPAEQLPPSGPPGIKGRVLRGTVQQTLKLLARKDAESQTKAYTLLTEAANRFDTNED